MKRALSLWPTVAFAIILTLFLVLFGSLAYGQFNNVVLAANDISSAGGRICSTDGESSTAGFVVSYGGPDQEEVMSVLQPKDGGFIVLGRTASFYPGAMWLLKLDEMGSAIWQKIYPEGRGSSIQQTRDGGYIVSGDIPYAAESREEEFWVVRLGSDGDIIWQRMYGGEDRDYYASSVQETDDGGYIVAGTTRSFGVGPANIWVLRLDQGGHVIWERAYGGGGGDWGQSVQQTTDGGYVVAGATYSFGAGAGDVWILKLDGEGTVIWEKTYGGSETEEPTNIQQTSDGGFITAVWSTDSFGGDDDIWALKLDANGNIVWQEAFGAPSSHEYAGSIKQTQDGGYIIAAQTDYYGDYLGDYDMLALKLDSGGKLVWQRIYSGPGWEEANSIQPLSDGGYIMAGHQRPSGYYHWQNIWVLRLDNNGNIPSCDLVSSADFNAVDTAVVPGIGAAIISGSAAITGTTNVIPDDSSALPDYVCGGPPPIELSVAGPITGVLGTPYTFTATVGPGTAIPPTTYLWQATDQDAVTDTAAISSAVSFTWHVKGTKGITVSVTNATSAATTTHEIAIYAPVEANFQGQPLRGIVPLEVHFSNLSTGDYDTCVWSFGDGDVANGCLGPSHEYWSGGLYTVSLGIGGLGGASTEIRSNYVTVFHGIFLPIIIR